MADWAPWNWDGSNWKNAGMGGIAGFAAGGPVGAVIGAYGAGALMPDGQQPYNTAQQGAQDASQRLQALSQLQWDRQMQGLQLAQQPLNNYRTLYDRIYGTNTANSQFSMPQAPTAPAPHGQTPEERQRAVNSMSAHSNAPSTPVMPNGAIRPTIGIPDGASRAAQPLMNSPRSPFMGAGGGAFQTLATRNGMPAPRMPGLF